MFTIMKKGIGCAIFFFFLSCRFVTSYEIVQEYLPRAVSTYGDGLENGQLFQIPLENESVEFSFFANVTKGCGNTNVTLFLRHDGLPIVNVYNASYPNFTWVYRPIDYQENFPSDGSQRFLTIFPRKSGSTVFGVVFVIDDSSRIQQQGLTRSCTTLFWGRIERFTNETGEGFLSPHSTVNDEETITLVRKNYAQALNVKWVAQTEGFDVSANTESTIELELGLPKLLEWSILSPNDIGGTLQVDIKLNKDELYGTQVSGFLTHGSPNNTNGSYFSANGSEVNQKTSIIVPYPLSGNWYLSLDANCNEFYQNNCSQNATVRAQIYLSPCKESECGPHGRCVQYFSAGIIYSACICSSGYAGWGCSDDTNALSKTILLTSVLLLTLSNLFFIPSIYLGFKRGYYSQCLLYFCTMFFSTFYHACDQPEFNYCLMPYTILQFGDFYSALASVWLTAFIVAKPSLTTEVSSAVSIGGVVAIAMAVHYNATSITAFAAPIVCGLLLIAVCWIRHSYRRKACYPGKSYFFKAIVPCLLFSVIGVVCFAFLETEDNYFYVHSIWHISIALAIVFVIPPKVDDVEKNERNDSLDF